MLDSLSAQGAPEPLEFNYVKRPGLLGIAVANWFLGFITFGIWHFWGKTNVRKHIWSCININNEPLEYTGTGGELFRGFLTVFVILILPYLLLSAVLQFYLGPQNPTVHGLNFIVGILFLLLRGFALYKARNYQLSRTNWRGIRGNMEGSAAKYSLVYFGSILAKYFSLGWATPVMDTVLQEQMIGEMKFGDAGFKFKGRAGALYPTYAFCWLLSLAIIVGILVLAGLIISGYIGSDYGGFFNRIFNVEKGQKPSQADATAIIAFILGIYGALIVAGLVVSVIWAIYSAKEIRTFANFTRFDGAQFRVDATAGSLIWLVLGNVLIAILTLGIGQPYMIQRNIRYIFSRMKLDGAVDLNRIRQSIAAKPTRGEGLADAFDLGAW